MATGSSSFTFPRSTNCIAATEVIALVIEAMLQNRVGLNIHTGRRIAFAESAAVQDAIGGRYHSRDAGDLPALDAFTQYLVDGASRGGFSKESRGCLRCNEQSSAELSPGEFDHDSTWITLFNPDRNRCCFIFFEKRQAGGADRRLIGNLNL